MRRLRSILSVSLLIVLLALVDGCVSVFPAPPHPRDIPPSRILSTVLAVYPSAHLPPVSDPYIFYSDSGPLDYPGTIVNAQGAGDEKRQAKEISLGRLPVFWAYGPEWPYGHNKKDFVDYYLGSIHPKQAVLIDEWQRPQFDLPRGKPLSAADPYGIEGSIQGIAEAKARSPGALVLVAWRGENSLLPLVRKGGVDYILIEAFTNMDKSVPQSWGVSVLQVDYRIWKARSWGMIDRTIPWLGNFFPPDQYRPGHVMTVSDLERQIRHYRKIAPEMPGLAFYAGKENSLLARAASRIARKYFIAPAPTVGILSPQAGAVLTRSPHMITAAARAKDGRKIAEYKGFIDNRLVYVGSQPSFTWDFAGCTPGPHIITVHAIDNGWNRTAAQISITCR